MPVIALLDTRESERHETAEALRAEGYDVEEFRDSGDLFDAMVGDAPDLLITNVDDPAIDGTALTVKLRHRFSRLDLPILLESASENEDAIIRCIEAGASDYLVRPYQAHRLLAKVHILLKERERRVRDEPLDDRRLDLVAWGCGHVARLRCSPFGTVGGACEADPTYEAPERPAAIVKVRGRYASLHGVAQRERIVIDGAEVVRHGGARARGGRLGHGPVDVNLRYCDLYRGRGDARRARFLQSRFLPWNTPSLSIGRMKR